MTERKNLIRRKLHHTYCLREFDNTDVWAGNVCAIINGRRSRGHLSRIFVEPGATFVVEAEMYIRGVTDIEALEDGDVEAALWTDANIRGFLDAEGRHFPDPGACVPMALKRDAAGAVERRGNNAVFASIPLKIEKTGVYNYTPLFSADGLGLDVNKKWIAVNDISSHRDGLLVAVPQYVKTCPSFMEICVRKYGAKIENGRFVSGKLENITADMENIPVDVLYLLPFFEPGTGDILEGGDVRKGTLGSLYATKDFFRIDPAICSDPNTADLAALARTGLCRDEDLPNSNPSAGFRRASDLAAATDNAEILRELGADAFTQIVGRAEMRKLVEKARSLGKKVIFDLVLMQTSRDCRLIADHRRWYALDDNGIPKRHKIAWLDYSDVALLDLKNNVDLRDYMGGVAPYWIKTCGLNGVRIDASQTVYPAFMKQIKNRINDVDPDALVVGETLCPLHEAVETPVDMIYSLFVDHHVHVDHATPIYDLLETYHNTFPPGTVALAYFENHDSERATAKWIEKFSALREQGGAGAASALPNGNSSPSPETMAAMKNIQRSIINAFAGTVDAVNFCMKIENGTDFGETARTDFENETLMDFSRRERGIGKLLHEAYKKLACLLKATALASDGHVFYLRNNLAASEDRVFAAARHKDGDRLLVLANLDPINRRAARYSFEPFSLDPEKKYFFRVAMDTAEALHTGPGIRIADSLSGNFLTEGLAEFTLLPLQTVVLFFQNNKP